MIDFFRVNVSPYPLSEVMDIKIWLLFFPSKVVSQHPEISYPIIFRGKPRDANQLHDFFYCIFGHSFVNSSSEPSRIITGFLFAGGDGYLSLFSSLINVGFLLSKNSSICNRQWTTASHPFVLRDRTWDFSGSRICNIASPSHSVSIVVYMVLLSH